MKLPKYNLRYNARDLVNTLARSESDRNRFEIGTWFNVKLYQNNVNMKML